MEKVLLSIEGRERGEAEGVDGKAGGGEGGGRGGRRPVGKEFDGVSMRTGERRREVKRIGVEPAKMRTHARTHSPVSQSASTITSTGVSNST